MRCGYKGYKRRIKELDKNINCGTLKNKYHSNVF